MIADLRVSLVKRALLLGLLLVLSIGSVQVRADESRPEEYRVKAAMLYKIAKFVSWPSQAFATPEAPLIFCVVGNDPFGNAVDDLKNQRVKGRSLRVRRLTEMESAAGLCHIVYLGQSVGLEAMLAGVASEPVLTVGDTKDFAKRGGVLELRLDTNRVRFQVNLDAMEQANLDIGAQLLQLATIVGERGG